MTVALSRSEAQKEEFEEDRALFFTTNLARERDELNHQTTIGYTDAFSANGTTLDAPRSFATFAYPSSVTDADGFSSSLWYRYDLGAKTRIQGPPPANQPNGIIQVFSYDDAARTQQVTTANTGAYTRYVYGPTYVQSYGSVNNIADDAYSIQVFDGAGRAFAMATNHPGSVGGYSAVYSVYDVMGRISKQSNPTEMTAGWSPSGDDVAGWLYTQQTYDWKGRPRITTNTDGTQRSAGYSACGCAGSEVVTLTDEGTIDGGVTKRRQQKIYADVLGRTAKTEVLNWEGGSVYSTTVNTFNARDQVTMVRQYQGSDQSGVYQDTNLSYDGYGRLQSKHVPEQDSGTGTVYAYNSDDTIHSITDARGATATYTYNNYRHLANLIAYSAPAGGAPTLNVMFAYDGEGNRASMTDGAGSTSYAYDQLSRMTSETRSINGMASYAIGYSYNLAGELTSLTDPFNAQVAYNHDNAGRVSSITGAGFANVSTYASNIQYRAWGGVKHLNYGNTLMLDAGYNSRIDVIPPGAELTARPYLPFEPTESQLNAVRNGTLSLYIYGRMRYEDGYGREYKTSFYRQYNPRESNELMYAPESVKTKEDHEAEAKRQAERK